MSTGRVLFPEAGAQDIVVEIAKTEQELERGLMFRKSMPEDRGMLFLFQDRGDRWFWMHNTCISLDMLFIDGDGTVVGIEENTPTLNDTGLHVGCPSVYVLEVNAGWARGHNVAAGQRVRFQGF